MKCIYCEHPYTYTLADKQQKCGKCKRKFSPRKIAREKELFALFTEGHNVREASKLSKMHFATVQKYYEKFRRNIALHADEMYQHNSHRVTGYDEYLYLPKSLKIEENIDKLQHFLTMSYDDKVYNIMMPKTKRSLLLHDEEQEHKLLLKYLNFNKIAKLSKAQSTITRFWDYFETFILQYKGVSDAQFVFYLKEAEWRFNAGTLQ
ncbi:MAG: transposase [Sulfurovum sp.]|nr:transposase [Sulfurovum sp.]MCB4780930.1 transposase [Sulfurovum sp.]MCB4784327.1 transposase [Sulfurovum sp.]